MAMHARDAEGRRVSLLNEEPTSSPFFNSIPFRPAYDQSARSISSSPNTPDLIRSDSYDSQMSNGPASPMTPYGVYGVYDEYLDQASYGAKRPSSYGARRSASYDDESVVSPGAEKPGKRYPCRYKESHNCTKTFTTSGHASRHSKIHTAEKGVPCSFPGCTKKFTRSDNMKQHLETHYKDRSRASSSRPSLTSTDRRSSTSSRSSSGRSQTSATTPNYFDMRGVDVPVLPGQNGLETLAMAAAYNH